MAEHESGRIEPGGMGGLMPWPDSQTGSLRALNAYRDDDPAAGGACPRIRARLPVDPSEFNTRTGASLRPLDLYLQGPSSHPIRDDRATPSSAD